MIKIDIPGFGRYAWEYLVLDVNGTISVDGFLVDGVQERLGELGGRLDIRLLTADTNNTAGNIAAHLGVSWYKVSRGSERADKLHYVQELGAGSVIAIGNGRNDTEMLRAAGLGVAVIGSEGCAAEALAASDMVTANVLDALDVVARPARILATLRA